MGTYELLTSIYKHWNHPISPVYRHDQRQGPPWQKLPLDRWFTRAVRLLFLIGFITLVIVGVRVVTDQALSWALSTLLLQTLCLGIGGVFLVGLFALTFLWPIAIAVLASDTIVREREKRTWSALLTTPMDWGDLLTAKLASALRWLNRPTELLLWVQGLFVALTFIIVIALANKIDSDIPPWVTVLLSIVATVQFAIARFQDYTTASVIGLGASMFSESRQNASVIALLISLGMLLSRLLFTVIMIAAAQINPTPPPQGILILLATGPTGAIAMALSRLPVLAFAVLIMLPFLREAILRLAYKWIVLHLGEAAGNG
jgi:hypothetical protein